MIFGTGFSTRWALGLVLVILNSGWQWPLDGVHTTYNLPLKSNPITKSVTISNSSTFLSIYHTKSTNEIRFNITAIFIFYYTFRTDASEAQNLLLNASTEILWSLSTAVSSSMRTFLSMLLHSLFALSPESFSEESDERPESPEPKSKVAAR